jgi:cell division protease FtsH
MAEAHPPPRPPRDPMDPQQYKAPSPFDGHAFMWLEAMFLGYFLLLTFFQPASQQISYTDFKKALMSDRVVSVTFRGDQIHGNYSEGTGDESRFRAVQPTPADETLLPLLEERNVQISAESTSQSAWLSILLAMVPWLLIVLFFVYFGRIAQQRMGGGREGLFEIESTAV